MLFEIKKIGKIIYSNSFGSVKSSMKKRRFVEESGLGLNSIDMGMRL